MEKGLFDNIDITNFRAPEQFFFVRKKEREVELFRTGKHCLKPPTANEARWVRFPILIQIEEGKQYEINYEFVTTYPMKRVFFLAVDRKPQVFELSEITPYEIINGHIRFVSKLSGKADLIVTATDMPIAGNYLHIRKLQLYEVSK